MAKGRYIPAGMVEFIKQYERKRVALRKPEIERMQRQFTAQAAALGLVWYEGDESSTRPEPTPPPPSPRVRPPPPSPATAPVKQPNKPQQRRGRRPGSVSETTKAAVAAIVAYLAEGGELPATERELARTAAEFASNSGLPGADRLDPDGGSMRAIAQSVLAALHHIKAGQ